MFRPNSSKKAKAIFIEAAKCHGKLHHENIIQREINYFCLKSLSINNILIILILLIEEFRIFYFDFIKLHENTQEETLINNWIEN